MAEPVQVAGSPKVDIEIAGKPIADAHFISYSVDRDMFMPDMASIVLANQNDIYSTKPVGAAVEIKVGDNAVSVFKGEIVGLEPVYKGGEKAKILIRAMNKFHLLLRKRKSVTFTDKTDEQILKQVVSGSGLSLEWKHDKSITYKHVYQHNLTDLEFIRMRAARLGCHVWCVDSKISVKEPDLQSGPIAQLKMSGTQEEGIKSFTPRLSSASIVKKVTVKGWNPEKKELITGTASVQDSKLGKETSVKGSASLGDEETFTVDHPIWSPDEANALAKARLLDLSLSYITGECIVKGDPKYDLGKVVNITSNTDDGASDDPFNGNYYIMGVTHRYSIPRNKEGGYTTILRLARDAQKGG
jgi:phage protein D